MTNFMLLALMFCGGIAIAVQPSVNSRLAERVGVIESSCISFAVGTLSLLLLALLLGKGSFRGVAAASWWELTGGFFGAFFVTMIIVAVPRIGTTSAMAAVIAAQLTTGMLLDHFGVLRLTSIPLDGKRLAGVLLLIAGTMLIIKR